MAKTEHLRAVELELLEQFTAVCARENLTWYASHGTLLGAVRDKGFLIRDDDIDLAMPTEDFNKLIAHKAWFDEPYFLQTPLDKGRSQIIRLYKNGTTAFCEPLFDVIKRGGHHGVCIDILPLDEIEDTGFYRLSGLTIPMEYYEPRAKAAFEHLEVNVPNKARKVLDLLYGYWSWPSGAESANPHYWFFDTETDYSVYIKRYTGWLKAASEGKRVYLFGAADSLRIWLRDFGLRDRVVCTFDNDGNKWGTEAFDVSVRNPAEIPQLLDEDGIIIIVSIWHREIGRQLEELGIKDYYVFLDGLFVREFKGNKHER
jgi:hypothetical protein